MGVRQGGARGGYGRRIVLAGQFRQDVVQQRGQPVRAADIDAVAPLVRAHEAEALRELVAVAQQADKRQAAGVGEGAGGIHLVEHPAVLGGAARFVA